MAAPLIDRYTQEADHRPLRGLEKRVCAFRYRGAGGAIVRRFKFSADPVSRSFLVDRLVTRLRLQGRALRGAELVPVPMHPRKRRRRRRDPTTDLTDELGERLRLPVRPAALRRVVDTLPQADPRVTSRARNVADAFVARPRVLRGRRVLLIDDVTTSGATARACAEALRAVHPVPVWLVTAALG